MRQRRRGPFSAGAAFASARMCSLSSAKPERQRIVVHQQRAVGRNRFDHALRSSPRAMARSSPSTLALIAASMVSPNSTTRAASLQGTMRGVGGGHISRCGGGCESGFRPTTYHTIDVARAEAASVAAYSFLVGVDAMLDKKAIETLKRVSTATITTVLLKKGLRNIWMRGAQPLRPGQPRLVGPAFTLRFVPAREDLATPASWSSPISTRTAIEAMPEGCIAVVDAMGITDAGIFGDILCARMAKRGVDRARDRRRRSRPRGRARHRPAGLVRRRRGAAVGRRADLRRLGRADRLRRRGRISRRRGRRRPGRRGADPEGDARARARPKAPRRKREEAWIVDEVNRGAALPGLYPMNAETKARYEAFLKKK